MFHHRTDRPFSTPQLFFDRITTPYYQPIYQKSTCHNGISGCALVAQPDGYCGLSSNASRWPVGDRLVPLNPKMNLLNAVIMDYQTSHSHLPPGFFFSMNVTEFQLTNPWFVKQCLDFNNLLISNGHRLVLEFLECGNLILTPASLGQIATLYAHGVQFSVDDFGAGFSKFNTFYKISPNYIKFNRTIAMDITECQSPPKILMSIVELIKENGMQVIAEGIETEHQLNVLTSIGIELIQGCFFGEPQPLSDLIGHIQREQQSNTELSNRPHSIF